MHRASGHRPYATNPPSPSVLAIDIKFIYCCSTIPLFSLRSRRNCGTSPPPPFLLLEIRTCCPRLVRSYGKETKREANGLLPCCTRIRHFVISLGNKSCAGGQIEPRFPRKKSSETLIRNNNNNCRIFLLGCHSIASFLLWTTSPN